MAASPAPTTEPVRSSVVQPSVVLIGENSDHHGEIAVLLSTADVLVTDAARTSVESMEKSLLDGHDAVILACDQETCGGELRRVTERCPDARVIVVIDPGGGRAAVRRALDAGAAGLVWWSELRTTLVPTVRAVCAGQLTIPLVHRHELGRTALTTREKQILGLVVMGLSNGEIAEKLYLAESTVKSHLSSAFNKLDVRSRNEATALILDPASGVGPGILGIPSETIELMG